VANINAIYKYVSSQSATKQQNYQHDDDHGSYAARIPTVTVLPRTDARRAYECEDQEDDNENPEQIHNASVVGYVSFQPASGIAAPRSAFRLLGFITSQFSNLLLEFACRIFGSAFHLITVHGVFLKRGSRV